MLRLMPMKGTGEMTSRLTIICMIISMIIPGAAVKADPPGAIYGRDNNRQQEVFDKINEVLVTVKYKAEMNFMGQVDDIQGRVLGISVGYDGMIIFDGTTIGTGTHFGSDVAGAPRVEKPKSLVVTDYLGNSYEAEFIGVDQYSSIAFCRLPDSVRDDMAAAEFQDMDFGLGDEVFVFWMLPENYKPRFGMASTRFTGILEKPEKFYLTGELTSDFIMSPVATADGKLIGVITPVGQSGGGYSSYDYGGVFGNPVGIMPLDQFRNLLTKPPVPGQFKPGWLGIGLHALNPEVAEFWGIDVEGGIVVTQVVAHSPAKLAGLEKGDFIVAMNGEPIEIAKEIDITIFQKALSQQGGGAKVDFVVYRPDSLSVDTVNITVVLDDRPVTAGDAPRYEDENFDLTVRDLVFSDYNSRDLDPGEIEGVLVDRLERGGWAAVGGIRAGDIILKINGQNIASVEEGKKEFEKIQADRPDEVIFMVRRRNVTQFVPVKTDWK